ncbi:DNA cytosine methyltransferase [Allofustis seminis]|uniref:DNA cytosine methyltransferase n=1 Tax=Allofustis seminis TaxID=166939 RepID=UPI00036D0D7C|nr:DNA cytosine methyltransferase [Allofustis seminis]
MTYDIATGLYDVKRLAELLDVKPSTIRSMKARGTLPSPTCNDINGGAVWLKETIDIYIADKKYNLELTEPINKNLPQVIDLFSGCGGMSLGFRKAGFDILAGFDNWDKALETYNANFEHPAYLLDLGDIEKSIETLKPYFMERNKPIIIGGPPCQDFSSAGKRQEGARADLTENYATIVSKLQPSFFVMENVARAEKAAAYGRALEIFKGNGYFVDHIVLNAAKAGVPQRRKRLFTFGAKDKELISELIKKLEENLSSKEMTVRDWFGDRLDVEYYYRHPRSYARRAIFSVDEPSPTIRGVNRPIPEGYEGHPGDAGPIEKARPLTTRERASLQTFPDEFGFTSSKTNNEQMIGNAVPVELARYVASQIKETLKSHQFEF